MTTPLLRGIAWDMDGTLVQTELLKWHAHHATVNELDGEWRVSDDLYLSLIGTSADVATSMILTCCGLTGVDVASYRSVWRRLYFDLLDAGVESHPGVLDLLRFLRSLGMRQMLVTSSNSVETRLVLARAGLPLPNFVAAEHVTRHKPYPDAYLLALKYMNLKPHEAVAVEDTDSGIAAAKAAGLRVMAIRHELNVKQALAADDIADVEAFTDARAFRDRLQALLG